MTHRRLRLGVDASMLTPGRAGVGNYVFNLLHELNALPDCPDVVLYSPRDITNDSKAFGECVEYVGPPIKKGPLWLSTGLVPLLKRDRIDVFWGGQGLVPLFPPRGLRTVVTIHDHVERVAPETMVPIGRWVRRIFQPISIKRASAVIAVSNATASEVQRFHRRTVDAVIHPRMDPRFLAPPSSDDLRRVRARHDLPEEFLLTLGTLEPRKNLKALLAAYLRVLSQAKLPPLLLAGNKGWQDAEIQAMVTQQQEAGTVRWLGYVAQEDLPALYKLSDLFVFVPKYEGFGMPVREALLSGARVLASRDPAVMESGGPWPRYVDATENAIAGALIAYAAAPREFANVPSMQLADVERGTARDFLRVLAG